MAKIKTVFRNANDVCKLWTKQSQASAEYVYYNGGGSRFGYAGSGPRSRTSAVYFQGRDLFSYGRHYLLGRLIQFQGRSIAVINRTKWSNTTSTHTNVAETEARAAGLTIAFVDGGTERGKFHAGTSDAELHAAVLETLKRDLQCHYDSLERAGTRGLYCAWSVKHVFESLYSFNKNLVRLGLKKFWIQVPAAYQSYCMDLARANEIARNDHDKRCQLKLVFDASRTSAGELTARTWGATERNRVS